MKSAGFRSLAAGLGIVFATLSWSAGAGSAEKGSPSSPVPATLASFEGVVEAERLTVMAAQVSGSVVEIAVKAGDRVQAGQVLLRLDAQAANQTALASEAQVQSASAALAVATRDLERQKQLFEQDYISQAALERAEARFKATQAETHAQMAQAAAARTQAGFYTLRAPYAGVVAEVPVTSGEMAMPGRPLLTLYDPSRLRVTAAIPHDSLPAGLTERVVKVELPALAADRQWMVPVSLKVLPTVDSATHTVEVRLELPPGTGGMVPGMFARVWLPGTPGQAVPMLVPLAAVVRRAEMTGLYVLDPQGRPLLRQVRLGRVWNGQVEILSGLRPGEQVAPDAQAALSAAH